MFDLDAFLPFRLNLLAERISRLVQPVYRDSHGLSRAEWRVLAHLGARGHSTASALIGLTAMDKVKVSRAISGLETRGWIARTTDDRDRRISRLALSPQGRAALDGLAPVMTAREAEVLAGLNPVQRARLVAALADLEAALAAAD
ncbi:MarR family transcriptional regulator [Paracoccus suum]|uniref:MarR family transcriptional regulator n=1 Tax=Paracoccus suum TaxID=2259340 RepID=A0A344PHL6_9RHOB|nr:MarR family winged helix-turn-helix transcriptional regulator [Paracoccus suum]AXC48871.1 MarR family transcriptional regulator [Paracoccus suum]